MATKKSTKQNPNIVELWSLYQEAKKKADKAKETFQRLEADASLLFDSIAAAIPPGETVSGVVHQRTERRNVSYSQVLVSIRETIIPSTKQALVDKIIEENTKISYIDKLVAAK